MKFSENWLRTWINPPINRTQLADQLTLAGLEINAVTPVANRFSGVVIGQIQQIAPHPHADRLQVCEVRVDPTAPLVTIVCGASNVRAGLIVAAALPGAILPNGLHIQTRTLRGVISQGMLCAAQELDLQELALNNATTQGLLALDETWPIGTDLWQHLDLEDHCLALQITPNRGDCLSLQGIAREVAALTGSPMQLPAYPDTVPALSDTWPIQVTDTTACPRYLARIIRGLNPQAKTPYWMAERLRRSGLRSIHPIVDISNYVLLELGGPLHIFDLHRLSGKLAIRRAYAGESLVLLNEKTVSLETNTLIIADEQGPQALAGIMGGLASAVSENTTDILLESAFFTPIALAGRARQYGLMTDASYRFERGVDPAVCQQAMARASQLLLAICGGTAGPIIALEIYSQLPTPPKITLRKQRLTRLTGLDLPIATLENSLTRLGIEILSTTPAASSACEQPALLQNQDSARNRGQMTDEKRWEVQAPTWRFDLKAEVDLIEEITRLHGYDQIPIRLPHLSLQLSPKNPHREQHRQLRQYWVHQGYHEVINYSFTSNAQQIVLDPKASPILLANPLSAELAVLRTGLWPGLINNAIYNQHRQQSRLSLFEIGTVFLKQAQGIVLEQTCFSGIATGTALPEQWGVSAGDIDFFDLKNLVQNSLLSVDTDAHYHFEYNSHPTLHPGQSSQILRNDQPIGWLGALHPKLISTFALSGPVYLFECRLDSLSSNPKPKRFQAFSPFPTVRRDLAFWVADQLSLDHIMMVIRAAASKSLIDLKLFDVYQPTGQSQRSLAVGLVWQHPTRTLTESEVDHWQQQVIDALQSDCNIQLRDAKR